MLDGYRNIQNMHGLQALLRGPVMPNPAMAIADDDEMSTVPIVLFRDQHLPPAAPVVESPLYTPYEKAVAKGSGNTLSMDDFVTDDFSLGDEYADIL